MFIYILCLIKSFVNRYLQKIYNIIRNFFTFFGATADFRRAISIKV